MKYWYETWNTSQRKAQAKQEWENFVNAMHITQDKGLVSENVNGSHGWVTRNKNK